MEAHCVIRYEKVLLEAVTELATSYLKNYYTYIINELGEENVRAQGITALLRTLLVKRGLSSPEALVINFGKLVEKRSKFMDLSEMGIP